MNFKEGYWVTQHQWETKLRRWQQPKDAKEMGTEPALCHWAKMVRMPLCYYHCFRIPDLTTATMTKFLWSLHVSVTLSRLWDQGRNTQMQSLGHRQHFTTGDKERGVCPLSLLWWKAGNCSINSDRRVSKCEGAKNDRFPLTFGITKIRTILYVIDQNKFHMDSEYKCKTWNHKSIWRKYTWIFM